MSCVLTVNQIKCFPILFFSNVSGELINVTALQKVQNKLTRIRKSIFKSVLVVKCLGKLASNGIKFR